MNFNQLMLVMKARLRLVLFVFAITVVVTAIVTYLMPNQYTASTSLVIDFHENDPFGGTLLPTQLADSYMATQLDIIISKRVALKVVDRLKLIDNPSLHDEYMAETQGKGTLREWLANSFLAENLKVEPSRDSRLVSIQFTSTDPAFSAKAANAFAQAYIETNLELSIEPARQSTSWFNGQIKELRTRLEEAKTKLTKFQQQQGIVATDERLDNETSRLATLSNQLTVAQSQSADAESRLHDLDATLKAGGTLDAFPEVMSNSYIQKLKSELLSKQSELQTLSGQLGENHPQYLSAKAEVKDLEKSLRNEISNVADGIRNNAKSLRERERSIEQSLAEQKDKVLKLKHSRDEIASFSREVDNAQTAYEAAVQRYNRISLESQANQTNIAVLTEATTPITPSSPVVLVNMVLSVVLGMFLGIGLGFIFEIIDRRVRSKDDLADGLDMPVLGELVKGLA